MMRIALILSMAWRLTNANSGAFLASSGSVSRTEVEQSLLVELAAALEGRGAIGRIETAMRPMFAALPKNAHGNLERPAVRYALHRYFVQRHGWYVKGLDPAGAAWNNTSADSIAKDRVPEFIQGLFEKRLGEGNGLGLRELTIFAATVEDLVHHEATESLREAYKALRLPMVGQVTPADADRAIAAHMAVFIAGGNLSEMSPGDVLTMEREIEGMYPAWPDTLLWTQDMRRNLEYAERHRRSPFSTGVDFATAERALDQISQHFGSFQDDECRSLKNTLLKLEYKGTGRVRLSDFWGRGLDGEWQFTESEDYLRQLGTLDDSGWTASVVIPNYINSASNCIASSSFFSVCCRDECEDLLGHIERNVAASTAKPSRIVELVSALPSDTVEAPRNLSRDLRIRLSEIANHHGGMVPLHGRLFAQWMHHAYPRECPFPHAAGTTNPMTPDEWMAQTGNDGLATNDDMKAGVKAGVNKAAGAGKPNDAEALPWTAHEELVWDVPLQVPFLSMPSGRAIIRSLVFLTILIAAAVHLLRTVGATSDDIKLGQFV
jgi:diadenosine tetraphosphatase ApaH/serine/threonine PP2A family protein phosphatase